MDEIPILQKLEDIEIGQKKSFGVVVTESMLDDFAKLSGDNNPLHMDENYAKSNNFKKRVCHGMLLASFFSRLVGMYIPGKNALYFSQSLKFQYPCFVNDRIEIHGEVIDKSLATKIITLKTTIIKDKRQIVDGIGKVVVRD
jgi:acyl dehydratase